MQFHISQHNIYLMKWVGGRAMATSWCSWRSEGTGWRASNWCALFKTSKTPSQERTAIFAIRSYGSLHIHKSMPVRTKPVELESSWTDSTAASATLSFLNIWARQASELHTTPCSVQVDCLSRTTLIIIKWACISLWKGKRPQTYEVHH